MDLQMKYYAYLGSMNTNLFIKNPSSSPVKVKFKKIQTIQKYSLRNKLISTNTPQFGLF